MHCCSAVGSDPFQFPTSKLPRPPEASCFLVLPTSLRHIDNIQWQGFGSV